MLDTTTLWWMAAAAAIAAELLTGSFYLLMLAVGLAGGALSAHANASSSTQMVVAAVLSSLCVLCCYAWRRRQGRTLPASANADVNLDIGELLHVAEWNTDGTARVPYRGSQWTVVARTGGPATPGSYRVVELQGNRLIVDKA